VDTFDFVEQVRDLSQVPDNDEDITTQFILTQGHLGLMERFTQPVVMLRNGTWLHSTDITTTAGVSRYRLPERSIVQGLEKIECFVSNSGTGGGMYLLNVLTSIQATDYEGLNNAGRPAAFTYQADNVVIFPTPTSNWTLRIWYYVRPSFLADWNDWVSDIQSRIISITSLGGDSYDLELEGVNQQSYTDPTPFDLQWGSGNHELVAVSAVGMATGPSNLTIQLTLDQAAIIEAAPLDDGAKDIYVTAPDVTGYIQLPEELCNALVSYVGAVVLAEKGDSEKAQVFSQKAELAIKNIVDIAMPRSKGQPPVFKTRNTYLRRRIGRWGWGGGWGNF
jgi:hypothetical protein